MKSFLETVNYSSCNEDGDSELRSLHIGEKDRIVCITGSGARPLDLLIKKPAEIVSIDFNPCQNFLLELKMKAVKTLGYENFLEFLGVTPCTNRKAYYEIIKSSLQEDTRQFWDRNLSELEKGVLYQGRWERYFSLLSKLMGFVRPRLRDKLFACKSIPEQAGIWATNWNDVVWKIFLRLISSRFTWKYFFGDPAFYANVPTDFSIYEYFQQRFARGFNHIKANQSPFLNLLFYGQFKPNGTLPPHLKKENYQTIKNHLNRISIATESLIDYLWHQPEDSFDKYSLSDFSSYTNPDEYERIWRGVLRTAGNGALVCERQFLVKRGLPSEVTQSLKRKMELERELESTDNSIFYTFVIAEIYDNSR